MIPFLKWPGGKRWLVSNYSHIFPSKFTNYIEPFIGAGSVFFYLQPHNSFLSDINRELINCYIAIRDDWKTLKDLLFYHQQHHSTDYYYQVRSSNPRSSVIKAARLIYLNRTCFNGIYRVNSKGQFNVPKGTKDKVVLDSDDFEAMAALLKNADIDVADFEGVIDRADHGDFVFVDPPYTIQHNNNGFVKYNENLFSWEDQLRLCTALNRAISRGAYVLATNADHYSIRELYKNSNVDFLSITRYSSISGKITTRNQFSELIIKSY